MNDKVIKNSNSLPNGNDKAKIDEDSKKDCRYCHESIHPEAEVCYHCQRHQNLFWQHFRIDHIGLLISIIMVLIALFQLSEAREERIAASKALLRAEETEKNVKNLQESIRQQALLLTRIEWLSLSTKHEFGTERAQKAAEKILEDVNLILYNAIPDDKERAEWIRELEQTLPDKKE